MLKNENAMYLYRQLAQQRWLLRAKFTPEETGSHTYVEAKDGPIPAGPTDWHSWLHGAWQAHQLSVTPLFL